MNTEQSFLSSVLQENESAIELCDMIFFISQIWDDLVDNDKPVKIDDINAAFKHALIDIPLNHFFIAHQHSILPLMNIFIHDWLDANEIEQSGDETLKPVAYVIRDNACKLITHCAEIIGGYDWARTTSLLVRRFAHNEPIEDYLMELNR